MIRGSGFFSLRQSSMSMAFMTNSFRLAISPLVKFPTAISTSSSSSSPSVSGIWDALTGGGNRARDAVLANRRGMLLFRQGDVHGSLAECDKAIELDPGMFEEGAEQFWIDVEQNPNGTDESIWRFLCEAQLYGVDEARKRFFEVGRDPRPVMREAYNLFKNGGDPEELL